MINTTPVLLETWANRIKIEIAANNRFDINKSNKFLSFKFKDINKDLGAFIFQFSYNDDKNWYEEFDENNKLHFVFPSGQNRLLIRAIDSAKKAVTKNLEITTFSEISLTKKPWYKPVSFIFILFPLIFYFLSKKYDKKIFSLNQKLSLEQQRNKMLSDLHDDVGATLSSLQINSAVANQLITSNPQKAKAVLQKLEVQSEKLSESISDIIWSMKPGKDEFMTLSSRIKTFASDIAGSTNIDYAVNIDKEADIRIKDFTLRKNIVLIIKEAVNNAVKYSNGTQLSIDVHLINNKVHITVTDNGKGMEVNENIGNGLSNMKKRAAELNGTFEIKTANNKGTTIECILPF